MTVDELIHSASNHLEIVMSLCGQIDERVKEGVKSIENARNTEEKLNEAFSIERKEREKAIDTLKSEEKGLESKLTPLREEKQRLDTEIGTSVTKKADLQIENVRLEAKNTEFRSYEDKAWKVLNAKNDELVEREQAIEQKENLRPHTKSLLPPIEQ